MSGILLFRKEALDKLNAPEDLDTAVRLVTPSRWLALAALLSLVITATLWGLFGMTYQTVEGAGVIELRNTDRTARVYVSAAGAPTVRIGQVASVRVPGMNNPLRGNVVSIDSTPEKATALAELEAADPSLRAHHLAGQLVGVVIRLPRATAATPTFAGYSVRCTIIESPVRPIALLFPRLSHVFGL